MKLIDVINSYVTLQKSLGMSFESASRILRRLSRNIGDVRIDQVRPQAVAEFLQGTAPLSATWRRNLSVAPRYLQPATTQPFAMT
jgi:integrase/recombinase XerD